MAAIPPMTCPEIETLFVGISEGDETLLAHAAECAACSALLEEDRQLEKDLFRIQDPLPPPDFTAKVMARVAEAPVPVATEVKAGLAILFVAAGLFVTALLAGGVSGADVGTRLARAVVEIRSVLIAAINAVEAIWATAAGPTVAIALLLIVSSLLWFRRLSSAPQSA